MAKSPRIAVSRFKADLFRLTQLLDIDVNVAYRKVILDLHTGITEKNPVDTGYSQANWMIEFGEPSREVLSKDTVSSVSNEAHFAFQREIGDAGINDKAYITNAVDYVKYLEDGSSSQAPLGMVRLTMAEVAAQISFEISQRE